MFLKLILLIFVLSCGATTSSFHQYPENKRAIFKDKEGKLIIGPKIIKKVPIYYPEIALKAGIEGTVIVNVTIDRDGASSDFKIHSGHPMLNDAVMKAIKQYKFRAGYKDGKSIKAIWQFPFKFQIDENEIYANQFRLWY